MPDESAIRAAERAKIEAIVAEHGTEREQFQLVLSGVMRAGVTLAQLEGTEPIGYLPPDPELLARLTRRAERRAKFGLPAVECAGDPPTRYGCNCLERALDEPGDEGKCAVLKLAARLHWSPPPRPEPATPKEEPTPSAQEPPTPALTPSEDVAEAAPDPPAQPEPPARVVRRRPKWFDQPSRFEDMTF
jgi:hypothetical protein